MLPPGEKQGLFLALDLIGHSSWEGGVCAEPAG